MSGKTRFVSGFTFFVFAFIAVFSCFAADGETSSKAAGQLASAESSPIQITRGEADLRIPTDTPPGQVWRYSGGVPFQVAPRTAGLFCGVARRSTRCVDFGGGINLVLFDDLDKISAADAVPLLRSHEAINPNTRKPSIMAVGSFGAGFVPLGAKKADGSGHPHAGTGFAISYVGSFPKDLSVKRPWRDPNYVTYIELHQLSYDGKTFRLDRTERIAADFLPGGWKILNTGLPTAIADGDDLLYGILCGKVGTNAISGVARFRRKGAKWRPVSFVPVTDLKSGWTEPSLIRDIDGNLLFTARGRMGAANYDVAVWRSADDGATWKQLFYLKRIRSQAPVTINQLADGTVYIAANKSGPGLYRDILALWPLNEKKTGLEAPTIARDAPAEFGPAPGKTERYAWAVDHPTSAIVRLADGRWHNVMSYRILAVAENRVGLAPTPHSGCYVEEVLSRGEDIIFPWSF